MKHSSVTLHVLYIPGLGDSRVCGQAAAVRPWRLFGVQPEILRMRWAEDEPWEAKLGRLLERIDALHTAGKRVALVGSSAGAIPVITAFAARPQIVGCVVIAGKVNRPESIGTGYQAQNPALLDAARDCKRALQTLDAATRRRIQSRYALLDEVVRREDSYIPGAQNRRLLSIGHVFTIATQITCGAPPWLRFLRRLPAPSTTV